MQPPLTIKPASFRPTAPVSGSESIASIIRGFNIKFRGLAPLTYIENYEGSKDLGENYDLSGETLTGTVSLTAGSRTATGVSTAFLTKIVVGQMLLIGSEPVVVRAILSDTVFITDRRSTQTLSGQTAYYMLQLGEVDRQRWVMRRGSVIQIERDDLLFVGSGSLFLNGVDTTFDAANTPKRLELAPAGTFTEFPLGFPDPPPLPSIDVVTGGTKLMSLGKRSFLISYYNTVSKEFSNPTEVIKKDSAGTSDLEIATEGDQFEIDFTASLVGKPDNADAFRIWGTSSGGGVTAVNESLFNEGAWQYVTDIAIDDLDGSNKATFEYLDGELGQFASGDNFPPGECLYLAEFAGTHFFISTLGQRRTASDSGSAPGNFVIPSKENNIGAAPLEQATNVGETINGYVAGIGRLFCMTSSRLPFVTATGNDLISRLTNTTGVNRIFTSRPFWSKGGISTKQITIVQGEIFMFSGGKPLRSPSNADEKSVQPFEFGKIAEDITDDFADGHVFVEHDPKNQEVCFVMSAIRQNSSGYWESDILPLDLQSNQFMPLVTLTSDTQDMIVSGTAIVNGRLEFLAGGRRASGNPQIRTYRYDEIDDTPAPINYRFALQPTDLETDITKLIRALSVKGRFDGGLTVKVIASTPGGTISLDDLRAGTNQIGSSFTFASSSEITEYFKKWQMINSLKTYSLVFEGTWSGSGDNDRLDEISLYIEKYGSNM